MGIHTILALRKSPKLSFKQDCSLPYISPRKLQNGTCLIQKSVVKLYVDNSTTLTKTGVKAMQGIKKFNIYFNQSMNTAQNHFVTNFPQANASSLPFL